MFGYSTWSAFILLFLHLSIFTEQGGDWTCSCCSSCLNPNDFFLIPNLCGPQLGGKTVICKNWANGFIFHEMLHLPTHPLSCLLDNASLLLWFGETMTRKVRLHLLPFLFFLFIYLLTSIITTRQSWLSKNHIMHAIVLILVNIMWFCTVWNSTGNGNCWKRNAIIDTVRCLLELLLRFTGQVLSLVSPAACLLGTSVDKNKLKRFFFFFWEKMERCYKQCARLTNLIY